MSPARLATALLLVALSCACEGPTSILLIVETDRADVASLQVSVQHPDGTRAMSSADLLEQAAPRRLELRHVGGDLGPVQLEIEGSDGTNTVVSTSRTVRFEVGQQLQLRVHLGDACEAGACGAGLTCANEGGCREPDVEPCEFVGRTCDADAGPPEDGAVPCGAICDVQERYLPGDRIEPRPCTGDATDYVFTLDGVPLAAPARLGDPGTSVLAMSSRSADCAVERELAIADATPRPAPAPTATPIESFAASLDAAFLARRDGLSVIDEQGARPLIPTGVPAGIGFSAVATYADGLIVTGSDGTSGGVAFVEARPPYASTASFWEPLPMNQRASTLATRGDAGAEVALLPPGGLILARKAGTSITFSELSQEAGAWVTWGRGSPSDHGALWFGDGATLANRSEEGGAAFSGGASTSTPNALGQVALGLLDDRNDAERLWLCGAQGLAFFELSDHDWMSEALPPANFVTIGNCTQLALGDAGDVWAIAGGQLHRVARDGAVVWGSEAENLAWLAVAAGAGGRAVWVLDEAGAPSVYRAEP